MRPALLTTAVMLAVSCSKGTLSVVSVDPPNGGVLPSKCPVRIQLSDSLHAPAVKVGGTLGDASQISSIRRTTDKPEDTLELYPPYRDWKIGTQSFNYSIEELLGPKVSDTLSYGVQQSPDERWTRAAGHLRGTFIQGDINALWFADALTAYATIYNGTVLKTADAGATWSQVAYFPDQPFNGVWASDASTAWVVSELGPVFQTTDGGATWSKVGDLTNSFAAAGVLLVGLDPGTLLASGRGVVVRSTDGGRTWSGSVLRDPDPSNVSISLYARSATDVWGLSRTNVFHSTDGGQTWTTHASGLSSAMYAITGTAGRLWAVGELETIATSTDGIQWTVQTGNTAPGTEALLGAWSRDANHVWAIGVRGTLYASDNGGSSWTVHRRQYVDGLTAIHGPPGGMPWAAGLGGLLATSVNGLDWQTRTQGVYRDLTSIWVSDADRLTVVGKVGVLYTSADRGAHWQARTSGTITDFSDVWGIGSERWASDISGGVYYSSDDGASWQKRADVGVTVRAITGADSSHLWMVGGECQPILGTGAFRSTDGGKTWQTVFIDDANCLMDVWASDAMHVWAVGIGNGQGLTSKAVVEISSDGGQTWHRVDAADGSLSSIWGVDASNLWVVGRSPVLNNNPTTGVVARSTDGGATWREEFWGGGSWAYYGVFSPSPQLAWGVGESSLLGGYGGTIFSTDDACGVPGTQPAAGHDKHFAVHGTADGKHLWTVGGRGLIATFDRP